MHLKLSVRDIPLFQHIDGALAHHLNECASFRQKDTGDVIVVAGEAVLGIYVVVKGYVNVYGDRQKVPITSIGEGGVFGEMALLESTTASTTIRAGADATQLVLIDGVKFRAKIDAEPLLAAGFYQGVATVLSAKLRATTKQVSSDLEKKVKLNKDLDEKAPLGHQVEQLTAQLTALRAGAGQSFAEITELIAQLKKAPSPDQAAVLVVRLEKLMTKIEPRMGELFDHAEAAAASLRALGARLRTMLHTL